MDIHLNGLKSILQYFKSHFRKTSTSLQGRSKLTNIYDHFKFDICEEREVKRQKHPFEEDTTEVVYQNAENYWWMLS